MITFTSEDWKYAVAESERLLKNHRDILENPNKTYKEKLISNGWVLALKTILNLPQVNSDLAAKGNK